MLLVVQTQTAHGLDIVSGQRCQEGLDFCDPVGYEVLAEDITLDHARLGRFGDVGGSRGENGVAIVDVAVLGQEANEALYSKVRVRGGIARMEYDDSSCDHIYR